MKLKGGRIMVTLYDGGAYLINGTELVPDTADAPAAIENKTGVKITKEEAAKGTMASFPPTIPPVIWKI